MWSGIAHISKISCPYSPASQFSRLSPTYYSAESTSVKNTLCLRSFGTRSAFFSLNQEASRRSPPPRELIFKRSIMPREIRDSPRAQECILCPAIGCSKPIGKSLYLREPASFSPTTREPSRGDLSHPRRVECSPGPPESRRNVKLIYQCRSDIIPSYLTPPWGSDPIL